MQPNTVKLLRMANRLLELELYHLKVPFRRAFAHAAAERNYTDTVVAAALLADGTVGYGEGLPRKYVTGETVESVLFNIADTLADRLQKIEPKTFPELLDLVDNLPFTNRQGQIINAARCCLELALLDAYGKHFKCNLSSVAGWMGYGGFTNSGKLRPPRVSGVLGTETPQRLAKQLRIMRWYGLCDFKVKLGTDNDEQNIELIAKKLRRPIAAGKVGVRADANGAWDIDTAIAMSERLADSGFYCLEQPLATNDRSHWHALADLAKIALMADESLVSLEDAEFLAKNDLVDFFNIRISKNGGLLAAVRMAELAQKWSRAFGLGAMVGETGILAAAGKQFLQMVPNTSFTEICYGTHLLKSDIVDHSIRFGYGGKISQKLNQIGLGVNVRREKIMEFLAATPRKINLA